MFTAHATDAPGFMEMCVDMYMSNPNVVGENSEAIRNKLTKGLDIIIMMRQTGGKIRIKSISEVLTDEEGKYAGLSDLYYWDFNPETPEIGEYVRSDKRLSSQFKARLNEMGVPMKLLNQF